MKLNRIDIVVPGTSASAAAERDGWVAVFIALGSTTNVLERYNDTNSGLHIWGYYGKFFFTFASEPTVATVTCTGMANPPSGSEVTSLADPGPGATYTWFPVGAPPSMMTSADHGGGSIPQGNNNYYVWKIPAWSSTAAADFTTGVNAVAAALASSLLGGAVQAKYLKYVDAVSGAWQVSAVFFGAGCAEFGTTSTVSVLPNNNILYVVTCAGTPHPPTGSQTPTVTMPTFTQTFTTITAPLNFGPQR